MNIAVDGPAGAGKSTIAKLAAEKLNFIYVDTGALYRAIALYIIRNNVDIENEDMLKKALNDIEIDIRYEDKIQMVYLNKENVSKLIRTEEVGNMASKSSAKKPVRDRLLSLQREIAAENNVIMDGRDIGNNVLKSAELKIYLTASVSVRAERRYNQLKEKGENPDIKRIEEDIIVRDRQDMTREIAPLKQAEDAIYLDTSDMKIEDVSEFIVNSAKKIMNKM